MLGLKVAGKPAQTLHFEHGEPQQRANPNSDSEAGWADYFESGTASSSANEEEVESVSPWRAHLIRRLQRKFGLLSDSQSGGSSADEMLPYDENTPPQDSLLGDQLRQEDKRRRRRQHSGKLQDRTQQSSRSQSDQGSDSQHQQPSHALERQQQQQHALQPAGKARWPARFPADDDLKCVLESGEVCHMLEGLQGAATGLALRVMTGSEHAEPCGKVCCMNRLMCLLNCNVWHTMYEHI